ncbi:cytochrome P450 [Phanerochaete sordida]|uniref:Cytochrome P450 n=1 Tax=Phanerochaete sordida TaxID=48140 RepID=A0A9P3LIG6_9APHY|nr:cytochrome P450 [Phanerochaete sordida]
MTLRASMGIVHPRRSHRACMLRFPLTLIVKEVTRTREDTGMVTGCRQAHSILARVPPHILNHNPVPTAMGFLMTFSSALAVSVASFVFAWVRLATLWRRRPHYPPGPAGLPIIRNLLEMPREHAWVLYRDEGRRHGSDVVHYEVLGSHLVVLNTVAAAQDLLDKRSSIYSDRPNTVMLHELTGWGRINALMAYGDEWRYQRKLYHEHFHPSTVYEYHEKQAKAARRAVRLLLETPERFAAHLRYATAAVILDVVYALNIQPEDETVSVIEAALRALEEIMVEVWMVDLFPWRANGANVNQINLS